MMNQSRLYLRCSPVRYWVLGGLVVACVVVWGLWCIQRISLQRVRTELNATEPIATRPKGTEPIRTELNAAERRRIVEAAIGPAPTGDAVPVLGYTTKGGIYYPPRWRTRPDADLTNNLK